VASAFLIRISGNASQSPATAQCDLACASAAGYIDKDLTGLSDEALLVLMAGATAFLVVAEEESRLWLTPLSARSTPQEVSYLTALGLRFVKAFFVLFYLKVISIFKQHAGSRSRWQSEILMKYIGYF
jgi:hypothetical protein